MVVGSWRSFGKKAAVGAVTCGGLLGLLLAAGLPAPASALESRFCINHGATYSRSLRVTLGDGGWSPFFEPGVVVWDGGSIIAGNGATDGFKFPTQTLSLVPRACRSYVSATSGARIANMLTEAPLNVDAHFRADADLDLCLVLAGGGDFFYGANPATVYAGLKKLCAGRRAAGFRVIVLTVLPRSLPPTFEASRTAYNQLVRDTWPDFADGLANIAADPRIGDEFDNLDRQYYGADATHPNNAGCAVMATVTAPVINALEWRSSGCEMRVRDANSAWSSWRTYAAEITWQLSKGDGRKTIEAEYRQGGGSPVVVSDSIQVDTVPPTTVALRNVIVRRGFTATLAYRVIDPAPCGPLARSVTIRVKSASGKLVKTLSYVRKPVNKALTAAFTVPRTWSAGTYKFLVYASDNAGNPQASIGWKQLVVK